MIAAVWSVQEAHCWRSAADAHEIKPWKHAPLCHNFHWATTFPSSKPFIVALINAEYDNILCRYYATR